MNTLNAGTRSNLGLALRLNCRAGLWATLALAACVSLTTQCTNPAASPSSDDAKASAPAREELYLAGEPGAPIKIEVFSDYECPRCREFYFGTLKPLIADYCATNKAYIVYHDYPLPMHPYARKATQFALAAARLGKDPWRRVTEALYQYQGAWAQDGNIEAILATVLDPTEMLRVKKLATDPEIDAAVEQEIALAESLRITGTPTFFVTAGQGPQQRVNQLVTYPLLKDYLDRLLKR